MRVSHRHSFQHGSHAIGANIHGDYSRCACGAKRFSGVKDDTMVSEYTARNGRMARVSHLRSGRLMRLGNDKGPPERS